jgi:hypothetical protein
MSNLCCGSKSTAIEVSVDNDSATDPSPYRHDKKMIMAATSAKNCFTPCSGVGIIFNNDWKAD